MPDALLPPSPSGAGARPAPTIFLPKEHGSWSLALEPLALGLLVAPSPGGSALALAALAGFFARRPLQRLGPGRTAKPPRSNGLALVLLASLAGAGLGEAIALGGWVAGWPLLIAAAFGAMFLYFDLRREARALAAELAGCTAFAGLAVAIATYGGWSAPAALALGAIALARSGPTVLTVRTYLRLTRLQPVNRSFPVAAAALAAAALGVLAARRLVPGLAAALAILWLIRTGWLVSPRRPGWSAKQLGIAESLLGALCLGALALAYRC